MASPSKQVKIADYNLGPYGLRATRPVFAISKAYKKLYDELLDYTSGRSAGGSVLISGYRGSGKTTLVSNVIRDLTATLGEQQHSNRPLIVPLHGPDLLEVARSAQSKVSDVNAKPPEQPAEQLTDENKLIKNVLEHLTISLYRSLANEFFYSFQRKVMLSNRAAELKELVGLLRLELDESTDVSVLRSIWAEAGFLDTGMLFNNRGFDQGVQEIVLLSSAAQAFRIVAGSTSDEQTSSNDIERESSYSSEYKLVSKDVINAVFGLLSGVAVGAGVAQAVGNDYKFLLGSLAGIVTALFSNFTFTQASKGSTKKKKSREYKFIRNTDISSLNRELPDLIHRARDIGLAPVFVVDELDKVMPPFDGFGKLIGYLKKLVSDSSFFCFLTDRNYFDFISSIYKEHKYPVEYTYFSNRFYVNYSPVDLHIYLDQLFQLDTIQDRELKADALLMQYLLLNRASLHTIDLKREILRRQDDGSISLDGMRSKLYYRFPIMIQLAIESIFEDKELVERFDQDSYFFQSIVDTLYYPMRNWLSGEKELDISRKRFAEYIGERSEFYSGLPATNNSTGDPGPVKNEAIISDVDFLLDKLNELVELLLDSRKLYDKLIMVQVNSDVPEKQEIWQIVINTIPTQKPNSSINLGLLKKLTNYSYEWRFDYYGRALERGEENKDIGEKMTLLLELHKFLKSLTGNEAGLDFMARCGILNTSPSWHDLEDSMPRIKKYTEDDQDYPDLEFDLQILDEYYAMILPRGPVLAKSVALAYAIKTITGQPQWLPAFEAMGQELDWLSGQGNPLIEEILNGLKVGIHDWNIYAIDAQNFQSWMQKFKESIYKEPGYNPGLDIIRQDWWNKWRRRLLENIKGNKQMVVTAIEDLVCISNNNTWAKDLKKDINLITKTVWSDIIVSLWESSETTSGVPRWLLIPSLIKLGFTSVDFRKLKTDDKEWENIIPSPSASNIPAGNEFIVIVSQRSLANYYLMSVITKPLLIFDFEKWEDQKIIIEKILTFIKEKYTIRALVVSIDQKDTDDRIRQFVSAFGTDQENTFLLPPYGKDVPSVFKVTRSLANL